MPDKGNEKLNVDHLVNVFQCAKDSPDSVSLCQNIFISGDFHPISNSISECVKAAVIHVSNLFEIELPELAIIVVDRKEESVKPYTDYMAGEFGCIFLNHSDLTDKNVLVHEMTHCAISTGHRFLDEGLATYAERKLEGEIWVKDIIPRRLSVYQLLASRTWSTYFHEFSPSNRKDLYEISARFIAWMLEHDGMKMMKSFLERAQYMDDGAGIAALLESMYHVAIDELDGLLNLAGMEPEKIIERLDDENRLVTLFHEVTGPYITGDTEAVQPLFEEVNVLLSETEDEIFLKDAIKSRALTLIAFGDSNYLPAWKKEALYFISEHENSLDAYLLKATLLIHELMNDVENAAISIEKIEHIVSEASLYFPNSVELASFKLKLNFRNPEGNIDKALSEIAVYQDHIVYGNFVETLIDRVHRSGE